MHQVKSCLRRMLALLALLCYAQHAVALDPDVRLQDFHHTIWTGKDGAPGGITSLAQTTDGWLWLGSSAGLYRFDGVTFSRYQPRTGEDLLSSRISVLLAADNGDLWIGYVRGGVSVRRADGRLEHLAKLGGPVGAVYTLALDTDGSVWAAGNSGVQHLVAGAWKLLGAESGLPGGSAINVMVDQYGQLWASNGDHLFLLDRASGKFRQQPAECNGQSTMLSPDGRLWCAQRGHFYVIPSPAALAAPRARSARYTQTEGHGSGIFDRDGNLWSLRCPRGLCLTPHADQRGAQPLLPQEVARDRFDQPWQMSTLAALQLLEDREGNIWVGTQAGLERFRNPKVIPARVPGFDGYFTMARQDGVLWVTDILAETLWRLSPDRPPELAGEHPYQVVENGRDSTLVLAGNRMLEIRGPGEPQRVPLPLNRDGQAVDMRVSRLVDDGVRIWCLIAGLGLQSLKDGTWSASSSLGLPALPAVHVSGAKGQLWLADASGPLLLYDNGTIRRYPSLEGAGIGAPSGIFPSAQQLVLSGEKGMAILRGNHYQRLLSDDPDVLKDVTGLLVTADGDRWVNGGKGVLHVLAADWQRAVDGAALRYELIGTQDGYPGQAPPAARVQSAAAGADGQLWFMGTGGIVRLDPHKLRRNTVAPYVEVLAVNTDRASYLPVAGLTLPAGASKLRIDYTALSYTKPEGVRFRYRLDGVDTDWQDAGARRSAYYTNLTPGDYRFTVMASNESGVTGENASAIFSIAPTATQTWWFKLLCVAAVLLVLWLLYRWRLRRVTALIHMRLDERQAERERIARDLHDTLLQSVQGVILNVQAASMNVPDQASVREILDSTVRQANDAMEEGRNRVQDLRAENSTMVSLTQALQGVCQRHAPPGVAYTVNHYGTMRGLHPIVFDELFNMGRECLHNAFRHAGARNVAVELHSSLRELRMVVRDDGAGIPSEIVEARGRNGHWGLAGLYERAYKMKAQLVLQTPQDGGTEWQVVVPAALAYVEQSRWPRLRAWLRLPAV